VAWVSWASWLKGLEKSGAINLANFAIWPSWREETAHLTPDYQQIGPELFRIFFSNDRRLEPRRRKSVGRTDGRRQGWRQGWRGPVAQRWYLDDLFPIREDAQPCKVMRCPHRSDAMRTGRSDAEREEIRDEIKDPNCRKRLQAYLS
jgi:hypothetical protein